MGILQARIMEWVTMLFSRDLPNPRIKPRSPTLLADSLPFEPPGKPKTYYTAMVTHSVVLAPERADRSAEQSRAQKQTPTRCRQRSGASLANKRCWSNRTSTHKIKRRV